MKKHIIPTVASVLIAAAVIAFICGKTEKTSLEDMFNENVEALAEEEIIVGPLCMVHKNSACSSLGEVYKEHIRP